MPLNCKIRSDTPELVLFISGTGVLGVTDIENFTTFFLKHLHGQDSFKVFFDLRQVTDASMQVITAMARHMSEFEELAINKVLATSVLVNSYAIQSLIKLLFTFRKPLTPTKVTSNLEEACDFLNGDQPAEN